jgi:hypothetical protein
MDYGYELVDLDFTFKYFGTNYTQVSITLNGYVCLGSVLPCDDILVGLNFDLSSKREGSGQIYYKKLDSNSVDFASTKIYVNLFNPDFDPQQILMITYDNVFPYYFLSTSLTSFQIYLSTDFVKSFVTFKFKSCPKDLDFYYWPGLYYIRIDNNLQEVIITNGQQCKGSNVGQTGVWVSDATSSGKLKHFLLFCFLKESILK